MNTLSLIRWAGGKGKQLNDLLPLIPDGKIYVEPCGGGASVLLNRQRSPVEVYNDLDGALINLFQVVRDDETFDEFQRLLDYSPYSRSEFESCLTFEGLADPVKRAVAFYTVINQSISGKRLARKGDWARGRGDNLAERWFQRQEKLGVIHDRIRHVQIESRDALDILVEWDTDGTVFYIDPPYVLDTRKQKKYYAVEPGDEWHEQMVDVILECKGMVVLSGYDHPIYERLNERGWWNDQYGAKAIMEVTKVGGNKRKRTEIVYRNPHAADMGIRRPLLGMEGWEGWTDEHADS